MSIPAYEAMLDNSPLGRRMLEIFRSGTCTRNYQRILPATAETVGVSRSAVSGECIKASEQTLQELCDRRFDNRDLLIVYIDGLRFGPIRVIGALGGGGLAVARKTHAADHGLSATMDRGGQAPGVGSGADGCPGGQKSVNSQPGVAINL